MWDIEKYKRDKQRALIAVCVFGALLVVSAFLEPAGADPMVPFVLIFAILYADYRNLSTKIDILARLEGEESESVAAAEALSDRRMRALRMLFLITMGAVILVVVWSAVRKLNAALGSA